VGRRRSGVSSSEETIPNVHHTRTGRNQGGVLEAALDHLPLDLMSQSIERYMLPKGLGDAAEFWMFA
jgi:hypothetical protein